MHVFLYMAGTHIHNQLSAQMTCTAIPNVWRGFERQRRGQNFTLNRAGFHGLHNDGLTSAVLVVESTSLPNCQNDCRQRSLKSREDYYQSNPISEYPQRCSDCKGLIIQSQSTVRSSLICFYALVHVVDVPLQVHKEVRLDNALHQGWEKATPTRSKDLWALCEKTSTKEHVSYIRNS